MHGKPSHPALPHTAPDHLTREHFASDRRGFFRQTALGLTAAALSAASLSRGAWGEAGGEDDSVRVALPRDRVPLSFIIDDSTCLVNMGHFCTPQFAEAWPDRKVYKKPWRSWPREIPDDFVRHFGQWCGEHEVRGKYSIVPYPACVGWLDRELPGWSKRQLRASLDLVRDLMLPNWDIHPEMITHTRVIDIQTGRPMAKATAATMENSYPQGDLSVDQLTAYLAYALRILKECGLPCEGITTPGGFGTRVKQALPQAVDEAVRDVFQAELPHYFKYVRGRSESTEPVAEYVRGEAEGEPRLTMNVPAGTGDWFGGWQGDGESEPDRYLDVTGSSGRMAELIERRQPAVMLCHWPGMYCNGSLTGFYAFQRIVRTLAEVHGEQTLWMKVSEIGRYWAAKRLVSINRQSERIQIEAPIGTEQFTLELANASGPVTLHRDGNPTELREVATRAALDSGSWFRGADRLLVCFDLTKGKSELELGAGTG